MEIRPRTSQVATVGPEGKWHPLLTAERGEVGNPTERLNSPRSLAFHRSRAPRQARRCGEGNERDQSFTKEEMDKATRRERARIKAERTPRGQLSLITAKGMGKANAPSQRFPKTTCSHTEGGDKVPWRRRRKDGTTYVVMLIVGGTKCLKTADVKSPTKRLAMPEHCGSSN